MKLFESSYMTPYLTSIDTFSLFWIRAYIISCLVELFSRISAQGGTNSYLNLRGVIKSLYQPITARDLKSALSSQAEFRAEPQPSTISVNFGQKQSILCYI